MGGATEGSGKTATNVASWKGDRLAPSAGMGVANLWTRKVLMSVVSAHDPLSLPEPAASGGPEAATAPPRPLRRIATRPGRGHGTVERGDPALRVIELARALAGRIRKRPLTSLGVAVGVGFLVGGALTFRAGRIALAVVARRVVREVLKQVL
jgi:hypothetical protein